MFRTRSRSRQGIIRVLGSIKLALHKRPSLAEGGMILLKVTLILGTLLIGTCMVWAFPREEQAAEDDEWEDLPRPRDMDEPARGRSVRLPR